MKPPKQAGFNMIELLVSVAIVAILMLLLVRGIGSSLARAQDARAKQELDRLKVAFEDYYNDNYCYPPTTWFDDASDCGADHMAPYLNEIPCDRNTNLPYHLEYDATTCDWFRLYTNLNFGEESLCSGDGSGVSEYNYGVGSANVEIVIDCSITPSPSGGGSPSPTTSPSSTPSSSPNPSPEGDYYCQAIGSCVFYNNVVWTCDPNYFDSSCSGECATRTGSCVLD